MKLDGVEVPTLLSDPGSPVAPPIVSGHGLATSHQIVLGAATLAQLHKRIGDTVDLRFVPGYPRRPHPAHDRRRGHDARHRDRRGAPHLHGDRRFGARRRRAGDGGTGPAGATMPAATGRTWSSCGSGEVWARHRVVRPRSGCPTRPTGSWPCNRRTRTAGATSPPSSVFSTPPRSSTTAPWAPPRSLLAAGLALAAVVAVGLALAASVRRCRRDLALLKVLGFVQRQLAAAVAWHASIAAAVGVVIGVPLGIVLGRWLWTLFAEQIGAVPGPTVPVWSVLLAAVVAVRARERSGGAARSASRPHRDGARAPRGVGIAPGRSVPPLDRGARPPGEPIRRCWSPSAAGPAPCHRSGSESPRSVRDG